MTGAPAALAIFAHPDDESWMCAGQLLLLRQQGWRTILATMTRGEDCTKVTRPVITQTQMAKVRMRELTSASRILKISSLHQYRYSDGGLSKLGQDVLTHQLTRLLAKVRPNMILSFAPDGVSGHTDHRALAAAVRSVVEHRTDLHVLEFDFSNAQRRRLGLPQRRSRIALQAIDIRRFAQKKLQAVLTHQSQVKTLERIVDLSKPERLQLFQKEYVLRRRR